MYIPPLYPKTKEIEHFLENIMKIQTNGSRALRTTPNLAQQLSKYKTIRRLSEYDLIDITTRKRKKRRSIVYFPPQIHIMRKNNSFVFKIK